LARSIHAWSRRAARHMATVSCPSLSAELLESELFGHVKGAFTGAVRDNPGRLAACEGGTLFLDEIGELPPPLQPKLLRFLQDKEYERLGDHVTRKSDVRVIAATNTDLNKAVKEGRFREDLFYRLNVIPIVLPPLRERPEDIGPLARKFLAFFGRQNHRAFLGFTDRAMEALVGYDWPGNLRELHNVIERAAILCRKDRVDADCLPDGLVPSARVPNIGDPVPLEKIEEQHIRRVLAISKSLQDASEILGMDQATLWRRRKKYGI
ncbi:MAG: sigma 54-interacting transcriptional regulator, partial [Syntrophobacteraceae bacterium]